MTRTLTLSPTHETQCQGAQVGEKDALLFQSLIYKSADILQAIQVGR